MLFLNRSAFFCSDQRSLIARELLTINKVQDIGSSAVSSHRDGSRWIAHLPWKEFARHRNIHLWNDVVIGRSFVYNAFEDGGCFGVFPYPPQYLSQAEIDKDELLPFI